MSLNEKSHADGYEDHGPIIFASKPMRIGEHEWRIVVFRHNDHGTITSYEFRGPAAPPFRQEWDWCNAQRHWPTWNGNLRYSGMPKSLSKLYESAKAGIELAMMPSKSRLGREMTLTELSDDGLLWWINRQLHPLGCCLVSNGKQLTPYECEHSGFHEKSDVENTRKIQDRCARLAQARTKG
jgi:hypothetical protein